jgi:hypothetical protein
MHVFLPVKFEVLFVISFTSKSMSNKKQPFSWGMGPLLFQKAAFKIFGTFCLAELEDVYENMMLA